MREGIRIRYSCELSDIQNNSGLNRMEIHFSYMLNPEEFNVLSSPQCHTCPHGAKIELQPSQTCSK